jgi:hypothetical protein
MPALDDLTWLALTGHTTTLQALYAELRRNSASLKFKLLVVRQIG